MVNQMHFASEEPSEFKDSEKSDIVFYDVEVFPNLFVVCYKFEGKDLVIKMINPSAVEITELLKYRLVGFNNRRYDNHILYARIMGYTNEQLFRLSNQIINTGTGFFGGFGALFSELFPTKIRNTAVGTVFNLARGAQFITPVIITTVASYFDLSYGIAIAALFALLVGIWIWVFPETKGTVLNDLD